MLFKTTTDTASIAASIRRIMSRNGGGYRDRGYGGGGGDRYGTDYGPRRAWNDDPSFQRREMSPESRERFQYDRERERALYERDRYERDPRAGGGSRPLQHHPDAPYGRGWPAREPYDYRGEALKDPRDVTAAESRYPHDPRDLERFDARLPPAAPRYAQRDSLYLRERGRDSYGQREHDERSYERVDRDALYRDDRRQSPPPLRYGSPRSSSHRSSPSASRRPTPPQQSSGQQNQFVPPHSADSRLSHRESAVEPNPLAPIDVQAQPPPITSNAAPTGPRRSFGRTPSNADLGAAGQQPQSVPVLNRAPPTGPRASLEGYNGGPPRSYDRSPSRVYERSPYSATDGPPGQMQQQTVGGAPPPMVPGARRDGFGRENASHLQLPAQVSSSGGVAPASSSGPNTPIPTTPASASRRSTWTEADNKGNVEENKSSAEAQKLYVYDVTLKRVQSAQTTYSHPTMVALRKALNELADSDAELVGARFKTSVTEAALEKAKEEAEAWSIETARIELEQRNGGVESFWQSTLSSSAPTTSI